MQVSLNWLKEYVDFKMSPFELSEKLTMAGLEVEEIKQLNEDFIFNIKLTSNRGDCLSLIGIAREVAAILNINFKHPSISLLEIEDKVSDKASVEIKDKELCPRYSARIMQNIKILPSPEWLKRKLNTAGLRAINNVVDVTNFVLLELGQPLHAFDYELLSGRKIIVRKAKDEEKIITLDGIERNLNKNILVIADEKKPVAIAGVMGGLETEVNGRTKTILLESAHFAPWTIRKTAKSLSLVTESSYRFERGVDPNGTVQALDRAVQLILEVAGGEILSGVIDIYPERFSDQEIFLREKRVNQILGTNLSLDIIKEILQRLNLSSQNFAEGLKVIIPTFRRDLNYEIDLIEEIVRIYGYESIPATLPKSEISKGVKHYFIDLQDKTRDILLQCGLTEVITPSLTNKEILNLFNSDIKNLSLKNPLSEDYSILRTTLLPNLLQVISNNFSYGIYNTNVFEIGNIYLSKDNLPTPLNEGRGLPEEIMIIAIGLSGDFFSSSWNISRDLTKSDFFHLKGIIEVFLGKLGIKEYKFITSSYPFFHPKRQAELKLNNLKIGFFGEINLPLTKYFNLNKPVYLSELNLQKLSDFIEKEKKFQPFALQPKVVRDLSLLVKENISYDEVIKVLKNAGGEILENIEFFDLYCGEQIPPNSKSLAFSLTFRSKEKTLTEEEIIILENKIKKELRETLGVEIREK